MSKNKDKKKKAREQRVAKKKLADAARRREIAKQNEDKPSGAPRAKKVLTAGVQQQAQITSQKPQVTHRRTGG